MARNACQIGRPERAARKGRRGRCRRVRNGYGRAQQRGVCGVFATTRRDRQAGPCTPDCSCTRLSAFVPRPLAVAMRGTGTRGLTSPYLPTGSLILISRTCVWRSGTKGNALFAKYLETDGYFHAVEINARRDGRRCVRQALKNGWTRSETP